ncbi:superoxide dismutase [Brevundimonas sp. 3P9-tot-E]|uniref:superoxide dismutase n=1 Tax=Brevundimonas TaxID=41275 RepID=UPI000F79817E|nr:MULTISPECIES: superoxide dismutase [Brevundimonas]MDA1322078.1 superoxide dismutase [Pseudomonadota bacterium]MBK1970681.1 superoxide dismutase [Brevundimonas diminuta]MBK1975947.1 superoxide dismutase [Brevundimonas diminuta]MDM8352327.1 superoxide dismutase [Brevundimonas diminuta]RSB47998.1 superoxide dismutase [Brevundimonas sp. 357]
MIRKTALLTGIAGALFIAAPAFAQDAPQTPEPAPAEAPAAQPQSLTLTPGSTVKGSDGAEIGKLVGVQNGANGQELTVRTADGQVRPVPLAGIRQDGADIVVDASASDIQSAAPIASDTAEPTPDAAADAPPADAPPADEPTSDKPHGDEPH